MSLGKLHLQFPDGKSAVIELTGSEVVLGRSPQADIQLADPLTSSRHAKLFVDERGIWLVDLGSTNGTIVDGRQLVPQVPVPLSEGRRIKLGDTTARFIAPPPASLTDTVVTRPIQSLTGSQDAAVPDSTAGPAWRKWLIAGGAVLLLGLLALAIYLMLPSSEGEELAGATVTPTQQAEELVAADSPAGVSIETISPCEQPQMQLVVSEGAPSAAETTATGRPIESLAFLDLPFPYDGGNENFGGSPADFRRAVNRSSAGGRINSFFDHMYPLYPAPQDAGVTFGREPADAPVGQHILIYDGQLSAYDYYSGHPAYDFSTYVPRQPTTPVFAAADGIVNVVGEHSSGALFVKLVHQVPDVGNYQTIYWHLHPDSHFNEMLSRIGEQIPAGTRIGTMGNTGWSTGHHLHFEVRFDRNNDGIFTADESADPFGFIPGPAYPEDPWALPASFSDARGDLYNHGGSVSRYLWVYPLGASTVIPASGGGQTTQEGVGGAGGSTLCVPQGSLPPGGTVTWSWSPDPPFSHQLVSTGNGCVLSVSNADGEFLSQFDQPVRIEIPFAEGDLSNVDPQSLVIFWQDAGSDQWLPLPTRLDLEQGIAVAETNRPGKCALRGRPTGDLVPPVTSIEISGPQGMEDAWYDDVTVVIESSDESGVASIEYSLDAGSTWQPYEGPFVVKANGVPEPLPDDLEEDFGSGPGRFLILASSTDALGNVEDPPVYRHLVIDPSKDPAPTKEPPTMTPTFTITPSPTACVPMVTALLNANVRWGPGLIYAPPVAALQVGETAPIVGRNNDSSWWRIDLDAASGTEYWIADSVVSINCGASDVPVVAIPPTPTSTPTPTPTNTPTPTPTSTPTLTPTATLPPDFRPPVVSITHQPIQPFEVDPITYTASARDNLGVARIEIWVQGPNDNQLTLVSSCLNVTRCVYQGGAYPAGPLRYQAFAWDATGNQGASPIFNIKIAAVIK